MKGTHGLDLTYNASIHLHPVIRLKAYNLMKYACKARYRKTFTKMQVCYQNSFILNLCNCFYGIFLVNFRATCSNIFWGIYYSRTTFFICQQQRSFIKHNVKKMKMSHIKSYLDSVIMYYTTHMGLY